MPLDSFDCMAIDATGLGHPTSLPGATWSFRPIDGLGPYVGCVAIEAAGVIVRPMGEMRAAA
jgi:hypothetical protein